MKMMECLNATLDSMNNRSSIKRNDSVSIRKQRGYDLGQISGLFAKGSLDVLVQCFIL